ncbi:MAG: nuclear transport factor 2 family protein [Beijerinckiaceae bacterium]
MAIKDLADEFVALLKSNKSEEAAARYNADDIVSYEAADGPMAVCRGKDEVKKKGDWWYENHEFHGGDVAGPYVNGDQFAVRFSFDVTNRQSGERIKMDEVGIYTVRDGKIVEERFFY